jgi:hypothetical protein
MPVAPEQGASAFHFPLSWSVQSSPYVADQGACAFLNLSIILHKLFHTFIDIPLYNKNTAF